MTEGEVRRLLAQLEREVERLPATPMPPLWPCHACGNPGIRNLGSEGYCSTHLATLYATFDPSSFIIGVGLPCGEQHPEYGPCIEDLACCCCGATWAGVAGDQCHWCIDALDRMRRSA